MLVIPYSCVDIIHLVRPSALNSVMHFRRALPADEVATTEKGVNMWDSSSKKVLHKPPKAKTFAELVSALASFYKFA
ncbi:hypothetical protein PC116_g4485 [Phytophthora cactorum]|uniref:Uncharacterized protein n=1 Tax=Phytophthora cactorum TaxID=29920 RepID=A0A8T1EJL3_9STRA|nr:hypothetical protein Pcac1_g14415 [Phytophthora cactorum]KAG2827525.1 hypothetical protein PC111_g8555 [Phytophthora cactorum]KAG2831172.1 hypothetical protein PC112_g7384 [Phytophthora cactorum]KAG2865782.1 hypothetical protein PC113_g3406 [Phytophthora cactorum]KAG2904256.1 hypothetical protein PC114_g11915 [Phytophthora cactorum]